MTLGDAAAASCSDAKRHSRLEHFPIAFFAVVFGLFGFTLALRSAEQALGASLAISVAAMLLAISVFVLVAALYALKLARFPSAVAAEWAHPAKIPFFPAASISLLLMAAALLPIAPHIAAVVWIIGAAGQAALLFCVLANWIGHRPFEPVHLSPAWFIPAVGNVIAPIAGGPLGFIELSWFFFSAGVVFWLVLLTLVMNRLIFHDPLPERLTPTLVILMAPPAVAFLGYAALVGEIDAFARILLNSGYLFAGVVLTQVRQIARLSFSLSWWALSFPIAALATASLSFGEKTGSSFHAGVGLALTALLCAIVAGLSARTLHAVWARQICRSDA